MNFRTEIPVTQPNNHIDYDSNLLLLGSCFSSNIGKKLHYYKFRNTVNPYGILFNPIAIENAVLGSIKGKFYKEEDLIYYNEHWLSLQHHSELTSTNLKETLDKLNAQTELLGNTLKKASHIIITLGTSWIYRYKKSGEIVANCHKLPQQEFSKELLSTQHISESLKRTIEAIQALNSEAKLLLTASPIRHLKDGFIENQRSKAHLITAIHEVICRTTHTFYFPSYEIMMDDLRDYRFYEEDMIHPNKIAINYIWEKFMTSWVSKTALPIMQEVASIQNGIAHRPFHPESKQHQEFLKSIEQKINALSKKYPFINF